MTCKHRTVAFFIVHVRVQASFVDRDRVGIFGLRCSPQTVSGIRRIRDGQVAQHVVFQIAVIVRRIIAGDLEVELVLLQIIRMARHSGAFVVHDPCVSQIRGSINIVGFIEHPRAIRPRPSNGAVRRICAALFVVGADGLVEIIKNAIPVNRNGIFPLVADLLCAARIGEGTKLVSNLLGGVTVSRIDAPHKNAHAVQIRLHVAGLIRAAAGCRLDVSIDIEWPASVVAS